MALLPHRAFDTMLGIPPDRDTWQDTFGTLVRDADSRRLRQPAGYLFTDLPEVDPDVSYADFLLAEMDHWDIEAGLVPITLAQNDLGRELVNAHPDRFHGSFAVDPNRGAAGVADLRRAVLEHGARAATCFPSGSQPQVAIDGPPMYPLYVTCVELGIPMFVNVGVPGPRFPFATQQVEALDAVCYDMPDLALVMRHGAEPWAELAVELMLKWPGLHYSTSAFAPRHYPAPIIEYANTRGADRVLYAGYFPYGLTLERIVTELATVPFRAHVWGPFLRTNARRLLGV